MDPANIPPEQLASLVLLNVQKGRRELESKSLGYGGICCNGRKLVSVEGGDCLKRSNLLVCLFACVFALICAIPEGMNSRKMGGDYPLALPTEQAAYLFDNTIIPKPEATNPQAKATSFYT